MGKVHRPKLLSDGLGRSTIILGMQMQELRAPISKYTWPGKVLLGQGTSMPAAISDAINHSIDLKVIKRKDFEDLVLDVDECVLLLVPGEDPEFWNWLNKAAEGFRGSALTLCLGEKPAESCSLSPVLVRDPSDAQEDQRRIVETALDIFALDGVMSHSRGDAIAMLSRPGHELRAYDLPASTQEELVPQLQRFRAATAGVGLKAFFVMTRGSCELSNTLMEAFDREVFDHHEDLGCDLQIRDPRVGESIGLSLLMLIES